MKSHTISGLVGSLLVCAACGGDSDGGGGARDVDTGLPEDKPLADVTPAEFDQACDSLTSSANARFSAERVNRITCELFAAVISANPGSCRDFADQCESSPPGDMEGFPSGGMVTESACGDGSALADCTATVGELEACTNDYFDALDQLAQQFNCANAPIDSENIPTDLGGVVPASCTALEMECPGAIEFTEPE